MKWAMNSCFCLLHVIATLSLVSTCVSAQTAPAKAQIINLTLNSRAVSIVHLRKGYVTSVRLPEEVSSVVLGDPGAFKAEHSEAEPRLVFFKPTTSKSGETNALITTRTGHEVSLSLVSDSRISEPVDYVLAYEPSRSLIIGADASSFVIAETKPVEQQRASEVPANQAPENNALRLLREQRTQTPRWRGKDLKLAVGKSIYLQSEMTVSFSVTNSSTQSMQLLPPQVQLAHPKKKKSDTIKAEQVPVRFFQLTTANLPPGARADGVVVFERPSFKESQERLLLQIANAEQVDRPTLAEIDFVPQTKGEPR
jgi:hypothetical protein